MTELDVKLVKVDNWGIFFLQRLKHFFNRTDYCDLTLQFQDNAQLKVHRLVLSACTEYFELLERTCEMYEDSLVMPDDLQADVVVPIVNFMYTGQLEFRMDLLERLYQTSQIMNMPVLTKLLDAHRMQSVTPASKSVINYNSQKRSYSKSREHQSSRAKLSPVVTGTSIKRAYGKAFGNPTTPQKDVKRAVVVQKPDIITNTNNGVPTPYESPNLNKPNTVSSRKGASRDPRPTRYELPEELDTDNVFDNSFTNISYTSQPLMVHPETTKQYQRKKKSMFGETSGIRKIGEETSTLNIIECERVPKRESLFDEHDNSGLNEDLEMFSIREQNNLNITNQLFDQIIDQPGHGHAPGPKVTIETKDALQASNIDHAKIISEVLKKYPHLVKSNKNIKLKILNPPNATITPNKPKARKQRNSPTPYQLDKVVTLKSEATGCTYETDVLDSKEAARLIALGAENVKGPWICLICGTPGRALHFTSYYKFRRHLVDVHNEKPVSNMCEYCGLKSFKRNYLLHHLLTKHGVEPPPQYHFPRCDLCTYIALTEGLLIKHKLTHSENRNFRCNVCFVNFNTTNQLLHHIQNTGHKYCADRRTNLQCVYCLKVFMREGNLYAHLKSYHKQNAKSDGIIEDSDEENQKEEETATIKYEPPSYDTEYDDDVETQYQIRPDGNIEVITKPVNKPRNAPSTSVPTPIKQKILNSGFEKPVAKPGRTDKPPVKNVVPIETRENNEEIVVIDNNEYIMRNNQLIPKKKKKDGNTFVIPEMNPSEADDTLTSTTSLAFSNIQDNFEENLQEQKMLVKKTTNINQPIQIVVSNEEEYKALMNSNHSIIFDDGDTNKTLTVLSAPHNAAINTIDLDGAQSSDMMIIQDNYPISVSEALPGDNSNIVVVYSHNIDDHNKQFQLLTSQDMGAQFVQSSSAVISQNFTTATTVTPVLESTQISDSQITQSWQSNVPVDERSTEMSELPEIRMSDQAEIIPIRQSDIATVQHTQDSPDGNTEISSGADIDMAPVQDIEVPSSEHAELASRELGIENTSIEVPHDTSTTEVTETIIEANIQQNEMVDGVHHVDEDTADNESNMVDTLSSSLQPMNVDMSSEEVSDIVESVAAPTSNEALPQDSCEIEIPPESIVPAEPINITQNIESNNENNSAEEQVSEEDPVTQEESENAENELVGVEVQETSTNQTDTQPCDLKVAVPPETKEQIQNLTSEWSEDEYETEELEPVENNVQKNDQDIVSETESQEMEESVENIQQEMEKQINEVSADTEDSVNESTEQSTNTMPVDPPQTKITLLLNDWDENESQEGNDSTNGTGDESVSAEITDTQESMEGGIAVLETRKDDKIKSLVSDWDDDEEESKN